MRLCCWGRYPEVTAGVSISMRSMCINPLEIIRMRSGQSRFIFGSKAGSVSVEEYFVCTVK